MAQFLTDKYLKYRDALRGGPVAPDVRCEQCGYSLRGLRYGGACPECGTPILYRRDPNLPFEEMPLDLIKRFRTSAWAACFTLAGLVALQLGGPVVLSAVRVGGLPFVPRLAFTSVMFAVAAAWMAAVWALTPALETPQATRRGLSPQSRLRRTARWLQVGWVLYAGIEVLLALLGPANSPPVLGLAGILASLMGTVGIAAFALWLARFADWMGNRFAEGALQMAGFGAAMGVLLLLTAPVIKLAAGGLTIVLLPLVLVLAVLLLILFLAAFPAGLFSLSRSVGWSVVHARARARRDREMHERMVPRPPSVPETGEPIEPDPVPRRGRPSSGGAGTEDDP